MSLSALRSSQLLKPQQRPPVCTRLVSVVPHAASSSGAEGGEDQQAKKGDPAGTGQQNEKELSNVFQGDKRRKGRPAHMRSPYDTPLRDGNRDRVLGLLTERAARTLVFYLMETNLNVHHWLQGFIKANPIPRDGHWSDVSGDTFLRTLLSMPVEAAKYDLGRDSLFDNTTTCGVDPRSIAQRIMEIRVQLAQEFVQDLSLVAEDNKQLQLETLQASFLSTIETPDDDSGSSPASADGTAPPAAAADPAALPGPSSSSSAKQERGRREAALTEGAARERAAVSKYKKKPVVLPTSAPANWRMRAEVEIEVHGPEQGSVEAMPDALVQAAGPSAPKNALQQQAAEEGEAGAGAGAEATAEGGLDATAAAEAVPPPPPPPPGPAPSSSSTDSGSGGSLPMSLPVATPAGVSSASASAASSAPGSAAKAGSASGPASFPPLHPEIAEILPSLRSKPEALTADVASMLMTYAVAAGGKLHPDVASALTDAMAVGAKLHPEVMELLRPALSKSVRGEDGLLHSDEE